MINEREIDIINQIIEGDTNLFALFIDKYGSSVFNLIKQIVSSNEDAEEVVQDVFLKAYQKLKSFKGDSKFSTWLYRIAYNTAISATRKYKRTFLFFNENAATNIPDETIDSFFEDNENEQLIEKIRNEIQKLNPDERALLTMYYHDEKSIIEVAAITGISVSNVKIKLFRVRKKLYLQLKK